MKWSLEAALPFVNAGLDPAIHRAGPVAVAVAQTASVPAGTTQWIPGSRVGTTNEIGVSDVRAHTSFFLRQASMNSMHSSAVEMSA